MVVLLVGQLVAEKGLPVVAPANDNSSHSRRVG